MYVLGYGWRRSLFALWNCGRETTVGCGSVERIVGMPGVLGECGPREGRFEDGS